MRSRKSLTATALLAALGITLLVAAPQTAVAENDAESAVLPGTSVSAEAFAASLDDAVLVTPEELRAYGVDESQITKQETAFDALTPDQLAQQDELRGQQDALASAYLADSGYVDSDGQLVDALTPADATVTPFAYGTGCTTATNLYRVRWVVPSNGNHAYVCTSPPAGTVNYSGGIKETVAINSGTTNGRIYYYWSKSGYYYWSVWRNDGIWHDFYDVLYYGGSITMYKVQIG